MKNLPLVDYGFTYSCNGRSFSFTVAAHSPEEAMERVKAMAGSEFVGPVEAEQAELAQAA
jgi:hypothetical protein